MKSSSKLYCKSLWTSIVTMLFIISAMLPLVAEAEINSTGTYFWVDPPTNIVEPYCTTFEVNISIANAPETYAWEITLDFNNTVLGVMSISEGPWLKAGGSTIFIATSGAEANATGTVVVACTLTGSVPGVSGSGVLCTIVFHVESCGRSELDLQNTALLDVDLVSTEYPNNDGYFCATCSFYCLHDVAIVNVRVNVSATVNQGAIVLVNVTIHNEGNHTQDVTVKAYAEEVTHDPLDADVVLVGDEIIIGEYPVVGIAPCNYISVYFVWNTSEVAGEVYTICAEVIKPDDNDTHDNVFIGPVVRVRCPHDIDISDVEVWYPVVHVGDHAFVNITVVNEGQNQESFRITVWANNGTHVSNVTVEDVALLNSGASRTVTATWVTNKVGEYVIKANATVANEKDTADNEKTDGTLTVIYDDIAVIEITASSPSGKEVTVTIKNNGTDWARFTVYVWAVWPNETGSFDATSTPPTTHALMIGWIPLGSLAPGENYTFATLDPYIGVPYGDLKGTMYPPYTPLTACQEYKIYAVVKKEVDVDDNPNNDYAATANTVKARLPGDVNDSGKVTWEDLSDLGLAYGAKPGDSNWNADCDFNYSGKVDWEDLSDLGLRYGAHC